MNKVILGLIVAVCILGMALVMLNERLGRKNESPQPSAASQAMVAKSAEPPVQESPSAVYAPTVPVEEKQEPPLTEPQVADNARETENREAVAALAPPRDREARPKTAPGIDEPAQAVKPEPRAAATSEAKPASRPAPVEAKPEAAPAPKKPETEKIIVEKPAKQEKPGDRTIKRFIIYARENGATVRIGGGDRIHYTSMTLDNPDRIVLDMEGTWQFPANPGIPKNDMVSNIRIGKNGDKTRVVIDLKGKPKSVRVLPAKNGDSLDIRVDK